MLIWEIRNTSAAFMNDDLNESWNYQRGDNKLFAVGKVTCNEGTKYNISSKSSWNYILTWTAIDLSAFTFLKSINVWYF